MRGRRGGPEERVESRSRAHHAIGRRDQRLLHDLPAARQEVSRRDRRAVGVVEVLTRAVRAEELDFAGEVEQIRKGPRRIGRRSGGGRSRRGRDAEGVRTRRGVVAVRGPLRAEIQPAPARYEVKKAIRAGELDDHDPIAHRRYVEELDRILRSGLAIHRGHDDSRARRIEDEEVVVVCGAAQRIRPEEDRASAGRRDRVEGGAAAEVVKPPGLAAGERRSRGSPVHEVSFPRSGGALVLAARVISHGEVEGAGGGHVIDGLSDDAAIERGQHTGRLPLLKRALQWVKDVIDDDVATRRPQVVDVLSEGRDVGGARRVIELREGRHVIDDLQHRRAFVSCPGLPRQDSHSCRQVSGGLESSQGVHAI